MSKILKRHSFWDGRSKLDFRHLKYSITLMNMLSIYLLYYICIFSCRKNKYSHVHYNTLQIKYLIHVAITYVQSGSAD